MTAIAIGAGLALLAHLVLIAAAGLSFDPETRSLGAFSACLTLAGVGLIAWGVFG